MTNVFWQCRGASSTTARKVHRARVITGDRSDIWGDHGVISPWRSWQERVVQTIWRVASRTRAFRPSDTAPSATTAPKVRHGRVITGDRRDISGDHESSAPGALGRRTCRPISRGFKGAGISTITVASCLMNCHSRMRPIMLFWGARGLLRVSRVCVTTTDSYTQRCVSGKSAGVGAKPDAQ